MNDEARNQPVFAGMSREDWIRLGYIKDDSSKVSSSKSSPQKKISNDLKRPIHPILRFEYLKLPMGMRQTWIFTEFYSRDRLEPLLEPILRLASEMFMSPASVIFLYAIINGPRERLTVIDIRESKPEFTIRQSKDIPHDAMRESVDKALDRLAQNVSYEIIDPDKDPSVRPVRGQMRRRGTNVIDIRGDGIRNGVPSQIRINGSYITALEKLLAKEGDNVDQVLNVQFEMATTFCHELAHAVCYATNPDFAALLESWSMQPPENQAIPHIFPEPYFEDGLVVEIGRSWEQAVLNSILFWGSRLWTSSALVSEELDMPSEFEEWPNFFEEKFAHRVVPEKPDFKPRKTVLRYILPLSFVRHLHQQTFWDQVCSDDETALFIPKLASCAFQRVGFEPGGYWVPIRGYGNSTTSASQKKGTKRKWTD